MMRIARTVVPMLAMAQRMTGQEITAGPNVQVSIDRPYAHHRELWGGGDPTHPDRLIMCAISKDSTTPHETTVYYESRDRGATWSQTLIVGGSLAPNGDPVCEFGPDGSAYAMSIVGGPEANRNIVVNRSADGGMTWGQASVPFFRGADREAFASDDTAGRFHSRLYVVGTGDIRGLFGQLAKAIKLYASSDGGRSFSGPALRYMLPRRMLLSGGSVVLSDGTFVAPFFLGTGTAETASLQAQMLAIRSSDGGETIEPESIVSSVNQNPKEPSVPSLAVDASTAFRDRLYLVWRDSVDAHVRVMLSISMDKGKTWTRPRPVDDNQFRPDGSSPNLFLPVVKVNKDGVVGVSWYDQRAVSNNLGWDMRFAASFDGGETFTPSLRVSSQTSVPTRAELEWQTEAGRSTGSREGISVDYSTSSLSHPYRDTNGMAVDAIGAFHPFWVDLRTGTSQAWTSTVEVHGVVARNGSQQLSQLVDASDRVAIEVAHPTFNRRTQELTASYRIDNISNVTLRSPMKLRLVSIDSELGTVNASGADNGVTRPGAVWDWTALMPESGMLRPGEASKTRSITFIVHDPQKFSAAGVEQFDIVRPVFRLLVSRIDERDASSVGSRKP